jgi:ATP-dependent DNA ligase
MLAYSDKSLCNLKLNERKDFLKKVVDDKLLIEAKSFLIPSENVEEEINRISIIAKQAGVEGLVVKGL